MRQRKRKKAVSESEREKERWGIAYRSRYVGGPGRVGCVAMWRWSRGRRAVARTVCGPGGEFYIANDRAVGLASVFAV